HVPRQRGRAAVAAELGGGEAIGAKRSAEASMRLRHADPQQTLRMHVAKILDRERRVAIVLRGTRRQNAGAEAARFVAEGGFLITKPKRIGRENRRIALMRIERR